MKLCKEAKRGNKVTKFNKLLDTMKTSFYKFCSDFETYKRDVIKTTCKSEAAFNNITKEEEVETPDFPYNDAWSDEQLSKYVETRDLLEDSLEQSQAPAVATTEVTVDVDLVVEEIRGGFERMQSSISSLKAEIDNLEDHQVPASSIHSYENIIQKLAMKLDVELKEKVNTKLGLVKAASDAEYTNPKLLSRFREFTTAQSKELDSCSIMLVRKAVPVTSVEMKPILGSDASALTSRGGDSRQREQVYLEKTKPPKFNGDELDFPE